MTEHTHPVHSAVKESLTSSPCNILFLVTSWELAGRRRSSISPLDVTVLRMWADKNSSTWGYELLMCDGENDASYIHSNGPIHLLPREQGQTDVMAATSPLYNQRERLRVQWNEDQWSPGIASAESCCFSPSVDQCTMMAWLAILSQAHQGSAHPATSS
jgi:hypothetical protein